MLPQHEHDALGPTDQPYHLTHTPIYGLPYMLSICLCMESNTANLPTGIATGPEGQDQPAAEQHCTASGPAAAGRSILAQHLVCPAKRWQRRHVQLSGACTGTIVLRTWLFLSAPSAGPGVAMCHMQHTIQQHHALCKLTCSEPSKCPSASQCNFRVRVVCVNGLMFVSS